MTKAISGETKVTFTTSIGIVGANQKDTFTLDQLGWSGELGDELTSLIYTSFQNWQETFIDQGWYFTEE